MSAPINILRFGSAKQAQDYLDYCDIAELSQAELIAALSNALGKIAELTDKLKEKE